jgi:hypothetical protein
MAIFVSEFPYPGAKSAPWPLNLAATIKTGAGPH